MKRMTVVAVAVMLALGAALCLSGQQEQQEPVAQPNPLLGTWECVSYRYGNAQDFSEFPKGRRHLKMFTETHYIWFGFDREEREIQTGAGGSYTFEDGVLTESTDFAITGMVRFLHGKHTFQIRIEDDKLHQSGALSNGLKIEEIWRRVK